jgi:porphobilinogen synthase
LVHRPRRLRRTAALRNLVRETNLSPHDFILPLFVNEKISARRAISSMPGVAQLAPNEIAAEAARARTAGLQAVLLFGIPTKKDEAASGAYAENGVVQQAVRSIKAECPELIVITDVCLCEYMATALRRHPDRRRPFPCPERRKRRIAREDLSSRCAGADLVAPSDMMDGRTAPSAKRSTRPARPDGHHELCGKIRLVLLRSVSRSRRESATVR